MSEPIDNPYLFEQGDGKWIWTGVTLRDHFAGLAMAAIVNVVTSEGGMTDEDIAREAYKSADAMLKERAK